MTNDEAIDLIAFLLKDNSDDGKRRAKTLLQAAVGIVAAEGGAGWDFTKDELVFTTTTDVQDYYINRIDSNLTASLCLSPNESKKISTIFDVWYGSRKLKKRGPFEFRENYQGRTGGSDPVMWTAFGNNFKIGPIPGDEYELRVFVAKAVLTIEDFPVEFQYAPIYAAKLISDGVGADSIKQNQDYQYLLNAMRSADGVMTFNDQSRAGAGL